MEYCLIDDDDGHWFVVPANKYNEASRYFEEVGLYWENRNYDKDPPTEPDYLVEVGGTPSLVIFKEYRLT